MEKKTVLMVSLFVDEKRTETGEITMKKLDNKRCFCLAAIMMTGCQGSKTGSTPAAYKNKKK